MKKVIPYSKQWIDQEDIQAVVSVLKSDWITQGPKIQEFEEAFRKIVGARFAVAVSSGTAALHVATLALGIGPGDEVIVPPITFLATANAVLYAGAKPVFADIDPETLNISPREIEKKITPKTRAIYPVHFTGLSVDLEVIAKIAKKHNLIILEDAAHALGAKYHGETIGSLRHSKAAIFSFHPVKHITTAEGGMVVTNDERVYEKLLLFRNHGVTKDPKFLIKKDEGPWYYEMQKLGFHYRMTDLAAALGISQLAKLEHFVSRRREIAARYLKELVGFKNMRLPIEPSGYENSYHLFVLRINFDQLGKSRKEVVEALRKEGIGTQVHYIPVNSHPFYQKLGYKAGDCPAAQDYYRSCLSIPIYPDMSNDDVARVVQALKQTIS